MLRNYILTFVIILNVNKYCESTLTNAKQNIIESLNMELNIKHLCVIKEDNYPIDLGVFHFAKKIFKSKIFMSFMSVSEMNVSMNKYYKTPLDYYFPEYKDERISLQIMRDAWVYPPKTIVMPYGGKEKLLIGKLFTADNRLVISKYIWLIFDDNDSIKLLVGSEGNYIPFNCQCLILKNIMNESDDYAIEEIYHTSIEAYELFVRHFGNWNEAKGLTIRESDFYKRRLDMNETILVAKYKEGHGSFTNNGENVNLLNIISHIMNIRWKLKRELFNEESALLLIFYGTNYFMVDIGPFGKSTVNFYLAYDKKYEQHGISPLSKPFSFNLWIAVLGWLLISAIFITVILKKINKRLKSKILISDCLYEPFDSVLNQDGGKIPAEPSIKIASISSRIVALILAPLYTGAIASFILIPTIKLPFANPKEFVQDGSYKAGFVQFSQLNRSLAESDDPWLQEMSRHFLVPLNGLDEDTSEKNALKRMCDDNKFAFLSIVDIINGENEADCKMIKINSPVRSTWIIMNLNYESPYQAIFNRIVTSIRSTGNMEKVYSRPNKKESGDFTIVEPKNYNDDTDVHLTNLAPIFTLIGVLYAFSAIILFAEIIHFQKLKQKPRVVLWTEEF